MTKLSENLSTIKSATDRIRVATDTENESIGNVATAVENMVPSGSLSITSNNTYDVSSYAEAVVNVPSGGADLSDYFQSYIREEENDVPGYANMIKQIPANITVNGVSLEKAFRGWPNTTIPLINTANVMYMSDMFAYCNNLTSIPLLNTSSCTTMEEMFVNCESLATIPLLNTSSVENMNRMFEGCYSLETLPACDVSSVETMEGIFGGCENLAVDDILQWCTRAVNCERKDLDYVGATEAHEDVDFEESEYYSDFVDAGWTIHEQE